MSNYWKKKLEELEKSTGKSSTSSTKSSSSNNSSRSTKSTSSNKSSDISSSYWKNKLAELEKEEKKKKSKDIAPVKEKEKGKRTNYDLSTGRIIIGGSSNTNGYAAASGKFPSYLNPSGVAISGTTYGKTAPLAGENSQLLSTADIAKSGATLKPANAVEGTWFKESSVFDDGRQIGDFTVAAAGSVADIATHIVAGIAEIPELLTDGASALFAAYNESQNIQAKNQMLMTQAWSGKSEDELEETKKFWDEQSQNVKQGMSEFIKKDLYSGEDFAKKYISGTIKNVTGIDSEAHSVMGDKADALAQSGGQMLGTIGLQAVGVPWWVTTGATAFGGEVENALNQGADLDEATMSGIVSASAEVLTEKLFGGSGLGEKGLINVEPLTKGIANKTIKTLVEYGLVDPFFEGLEEGISQFMNNLGSALYKEENLAEILGSEEAFEGYLDSFIGGWVLSGTMNAGKATNSIKNGTDYRSGLTAQEEQVLQKEAEKRIAEAEKGGKKLTDEEKKAITNEVAKALENGDISVDTIEEVLGGETYKTYKDTIDSEDAQIKELEAQLKELEGADIGNNKKYESLQNQLEELKNNSQRDQLKTQLDNEIDGLVKDSILDRSYEKIRAEQDYTPDMTKYSNLKHQEAVQKTIESATSLGAKNTRAVRSFVDMVAKTAGETGLTFKFKSGEQIKQDFITRQTAEIKKLESLEELTAEQTEKLAKLKDTLQKVESGKLVVNGDITGDGIVLNLDSAKPLNRVVGHEVTHSFEAAKYYENLKKHLFAYAKTKGVDINAEIEARRALYEGVKDANPEAELVADLVGDYIFNDPDYINNLYVEDRNAFQKFWDEIKHLYKLATAGSKEARELERVKKAFEKVWSEGAKTTEGTKLSMSGVNSQTANESNLAKAESMLEQGVDSETIRQETGWFKGYDGQWRYEIDDHEFKYYPDGDANGYSKDPDVSRAKELFKKIQAQEATEAEFEEFRSLAQVVEFKKMFPTHLSDYVAHDKLFEAYPQLKDMSVSFVTSLGENTNAAYDLRTKTISINENIRNDNEAVKNALIHEIQHAIQDIEGHANGASVEYWNAQRQDIVDTLGGARANLDLWLEDIGYDDFARSSMQEVVNKEKTLEQHWKDCKEFKANSKYAEQIAKCEAEIAEFQQQYDEITNGMTAYEQYRNTAGEIEARDAENRLNLTAEERKNLRPDIDNENVVFADTQYSLSDSLENVGKILYDNSNPLSIVNRATSKNNSSINWVYKAEIFSTTENKLFHEKISEINQGSRAFEKNSRDEYMIPIENKIVFTDGNYDSPYIREIVEVLTEYQTDFELIKERIFSVEKGESAKQDAVEFCEQMYGKGNIVTYTSGNNKVYDWQNRKPKGKTRRTVVRNYLNKQYRTGNDKQSGKTKVGSNESAFSVAQNTNYSLSDSNGKQLTTEQQEYFKFAKTTDEQGRLKPFYHGTARADRVGNVFRADRATSGPMAFFTDNQEIADNYARDKNDTSIAYDSDYDSYETQFRVNRNGKDMSVVDLWNTLSMSERNAIKEKAKHITMDDDYENVIYSEDAQYGLGNFDAYELNAHKGNALHTLVDSWLTDGNLYREEQKFLDVLKLVGIDDAKYMNPDFRDEKTYAVYLNITNPFDTSNISEEMLEALRTSAENADFEEGNSADLWDKRNISPERWIERLEDDLKNGTTHVWTSIPDFVTDTLKAHGYDGILDTGGKGGGVGHTVAIPFYSEQIKNVDNLNPTTSEDIRLSLSEEGETLFSPITEKDIFGKDILRQSQTEQIAPMPKTESVVQAPENLEAKLDELSKQRSQTFEEAWELDKKKDRTEAETLEMQRLYERVNEIDIEYHNALDQMYPAAIYNKGGDKNGWVNIYAGSMEATYTAVRKVDGNLWNALQAEIDDSVATNNPHTPILNAIIAAGEDVRQETITPIQAAKLLSEVYNRGGAELLDRIYNHGTGNLHPIVLEKAKQYETIAPVKSVTEETTAAEFANDFAPITEEEANANAHESLATLDDADAPPEIETEYDDFDEAKEIKTPEERRTARLQAVQTELAENRRLRNESRLDYEENIARLQAEYDSKRNKNTKAANDILRRIERIKRLKDSVDADYSKRISDLETREKLLREGKPTTRQELHKQKVDDIKAKFSEKGKDLDDVLKNAKNLSTFATVDNTPQRVMEKALGYEAGQILADETVNKVAQNETEGIKWLNSFTDRKNGLLAQLSKEYNIKAGSKESAAAQMYAEGFYVDEKNNIIEYGDAELAKDFPDSKARNNIKRLASDPRIRQIYDETLAAINESRTRNAYPEIPRLDNYFLHFRAMEDTFSKLGLPFNPNDIRAKDLPTDLNGVTADLKPGQPYFASAMHRTGRRTSFDMLGGLERYLTSAKNQIYHIDDIQTFRALRNYIADTYGQANGLEGLDALSESEQQERIEKVYNSHLSTFAKFLNEEANVLAGKTSLIDRGVEGIIGRRGITILDSINKQVGSNMVGLNVSSSLTNFLAGVQAIAKTNKLACIKSLAQTTSSKIGSIFGKTDSFVENNPTIIRRKGADRFYRTPYQKVGDAGYVLMSAVDDVTTEFIVRAKYNEFISKGMSEDQAITEADKWTSRLMGDRSLGQMPLLYNSKMLGLLTKFQLEVRNQLDSQFYDTIQEAKASNKDIENGLARNAKTAAKVTATLFELTVLQHAFGKAFESIAGYNPAFDIISVLATALGFDDDDESEDTVLDNIEQGFFELVGDLPYTSILTGGRIPISSALPLTELFKGVDQYGNEKSRWETLGEAAPYYVLPTGYGQIKKTLSGLSMFNTDEEHPVAGSYTNSGSLRFPVDDTLGNRIQAGIFGQYASNNAREYFDNDYAPLKEKQIQEYVDVDLPIADYWKYREGLKGLNTLEEKAEYINGLDLETWQKNLLINNISDRKEAINMTDYDDYGSWDEFDYASKNPEKHEFFKDNGISYNDYASADDDSKDAYDWAYKNPEKYVMSKSVADDVVEYRSYISDLYDIKADKDSSGKSISGSRKTKVLNYINNLDLDYGAKIILFKSEYPSDDTYNRDIVEYLNGRSDISYTDMETILKELGFTVDSKGNISW